MNAQQHVFEAAGLGKAPFRFVAIERRVGPWQVGPNTYVGAPGQPVGTCQYCGQSIAECCIIRSADGRTFTVGNECVRKTGDAGLVNLAKREHNRVQRERKAASDERRIEAAKAKLQEAEQALKAEPHPYEWLAKQGKTAFDFVQFLLANGGTSGKLRAARLVEKAVQS